MTNSSVQRPSPVLAADASGRGEAVSDTLDGDCCCCCWGLQQYCFVRRPFCLCINPLTVSRQELYFGPFGVCCSRSRPFTAWTAGRLVASRTCLRIHGSQNPAVCRFGCTVGVHDGDVGPSQGMKCCALYLNALWNAVADAVNIYSWGALRRKSTATNHHHMT